MNKLIFVIPDTDLQVEKLSPDKYNIELFIKLREEFCELKAYKDNSNFISAVADY